MELRGQKVFTLGSLVFAQILSRICGVACCKFKWVFFYCRAKGVDVSFITKNIKQPLLQLALIAPSVSTMLDFHFGVVQSLRHTVSLSNIIRYWTHFLESVPK